MLMRRRSVGWACVCMAGLAWGQARNVYIDANGNNGPSNWNNLSFATLNASALLVDSLTHGTGIRATVTVRLNGGNNNASASPVGDAVEFAPASTNNAYGHTVTWSGTPPILFGEMVFSNLNPTVAYTFTFYASRMGSADTRDARYIVTGANSGTNVLNASNNNSATVAVSGITPTAAGVITLRVEPGPDNDNSYGFFYLNSMKLSYEEPAVTPVTTLLIDAAGSSAAPGWNRVPFNAAAGAVPLAQTNGAASGISMQILTALNGTNNGGTNAPSGAAAVFKPAGIDSCFGHNTAHASPARLTGLARFSGLATNRLYTFTFYASRMAATDDRSALFTLDGATSGQATLNAANNYSQVAVVQNIAPTSAGEITLTVTKGPSNNNSTEYFYLGALMLSYPADAEEEPPVESGKRLLFFGNSFSLGDDVPGHVGSLAALDGHPAPLVVADLMGGTDLAYHIGQVDDYPANNVTHASLAGTNTWDHVIIQGYSTEATHLRDTSAFRTNALALYRRIKGHASGKGLGVQPVLFQTWARAVGHSYYPGSFADPAAMQHEIRTNYQAAADILLAAEPAAQVRIAPVGDAFERGGFNAADLYGADLDHAGNLGPELAALVIYKTIYGATATNIPYATVRDAGWTTMGSNDWTRVTYWADGLTPPEPPPHPPPVPPAPGEREVFLIDAAGTDGAATFGWNTVDFTGLNTRTLIRTNGQASAVTCTVLTRMNSLNANGAPAPTGDAARFTPAGGNNAYGNVKPFGSYSNDHAVARFSGLSAHRRYTFTLYASRMSATDNREAIYTVTGATGGAAALDAANNTANVAVVADILPRPDGTADLRIEPGPNNTNDYLFYHLSAIQIESRVGGTWFSLQ